MKQNKTEIILLVDRSGSMQTIKKDMEGGLKAFIDSQKKLGGEVLVTYYQFDSNDSHVMPSGIRYSKGLPKERSVLTKVFECRDINEVNEFVIEPRGGTPLIEAVAKAIVEVGVRLANTDESQRPEHVIFVIITDGQENSSAQEYSPERVKIMIKHQTDVYKWKFEFLGANIDAVTMGGQYFGFTSDTSTTFGTNEKGITGSMDLLARKTVAYRTHTSYTTTEEDRKQASGK